MGLLYGGSLRETAETHHYLGAFQYYDYFNNRAFEFGGQSVGAGLLSKFDTGEKMRFLTALHVTALLVGGTSSDYVSFSGREYDYGPGVGFRLHAASSAAAGTCWASARSSSGSIPERQRRPPRGQHDRGAGAVPVRRELAVGLDYTLYLADRYYSDYPDVHERYPIVRDSSPPSCDGRGRRAAGPVRPQAPPGDRRRFVFPYRKSSSLRVSTAPAHSSSTW